MSKPKTMIKQSKKKKKEQILEDADDFLAAGVEHEESAGKWRAGDAVKSLRFFNRAVETYNQGLSKYPNNLDLAYNKARVELEVATHPLLVRHIDSPLMAVLEAALTSHRYALDLDPNNADTLFNIAQVLVSIAEELAKDDKRTADALQFLEEALEMQNRCLSVQELKYEESEQQRLTMEAQTNLSTDQPAAPPQSISSPSTPTAAAEDQWFTILEPITPDTLIDTILAQLSTLTTLCSIISTTFPAPPTPTLPWIASYPEPLINTKLPILLTTHSTTPPPTQTRLREIALTKSLFHSHLLSASFRHLLLPAPTYYSELTTAFTFSHSSPSPSPSTHLAHAEALLLYITTLSETPSASGQPFAAARWAALSEAITLLAKAAAAGGASSSGSSGTDTDTDRDEALSKAQVARTHFLRGDASLGLYMLGMDPIGFAQAKANRAQLLKNAEVFYRNASRLIPDSKVGEEEEEGDEAEMKATAAFRCTVAQVLQGKAAEAPGGSDLGREETWVRGQIGEMVEEGLVPEGVL